MPLTAKAVLANSDVRHALQQAWTDSNPGMTGGHEEGGFVVGDEDGSLSVRRWQKDYKIQFKFQRIGTVYLTARISLLLFILIRTQAMTTCRNQVKRTNAQSAMTLI